jgi:transaldolase
VQIRRLLYFAFCGQILAASIRSVQNFHEALAAAADAITIPVEVFEKSISNPLTDQGIEKFNQDWKKLGIRHFP